MAVYLPVGIVIGFFLAFGIIRAMSIAAKRADEANRRELLNLYGRESDATDERA